ncbi:MAG TPA: protein kinase [Pyrinomonadaceae bacterium]|nr:protein kinase [Pyrinomonadaceae bacterium]
MKLCQTCNSIAADEHSYCAHDGQMLVKDALASTLQESLGAKYTLTKLIGTGSMGAVYRARHQSLDDVAIKVMLGPPNNHKLSQRFLREARALRRLRNEHSVLVYDLERSPIGLTYIVMEMVEGRSLRDILGKRGALPVKETMEVAEAVCDALSAAHEHGIIHRDLKPDNIILAEEKRADGIVARTIKVVDFGIAKLRGTKEGGEEASMQLTKMGAPIGTPFYMSPEQWFGDGPGITALDGRTDIYSLGCTLYEMLTGRPPFLGEETEELRRKHLNDQPQPINEIEPRVPVALSRVILRALEKDRDLRPANAKEFATELRRAFEESKPAVEKDEAQPTPRELQKSEDKPDAEQVSHLQSTEESVPMVRNWAAQEAQQAIEQMRVRPEEFEPQALEQPTPQESAERPAKQISEPFAETLEDVDEITAEARFNAKTGTVQPSRPTSPETEFKKTLLFERSKKREPVIENKGQKPEAPKQEVAKQEEAPKPEAQRLKSTAYKLTVARMGTLRVAVLADEVDVVADWRAPVPLPGAPSSVLGVVSVRGRMLTVLDPAALLGEESNGHTNNPPSFIIALRGDEQLAIAADSVDNIIETDVQEIAASDENVTNGVVRGIAHIEQDSVTVLETKELFDAAMRGAERRRQRK